MRRVSRADDRLKPVPEWGRPHKRQLRAFGPSRCQLSGMPYRGSLKRGHFSDMATIRSCGFRGRRLPGRIAARARSIDARTQADLSFLILRSDPDFRFSDSRRPKEKVTAAAIVGPIAVKVSNTVEYLLRRGASTCCASGAPWA